MRIHKKDFSLLELVIENGRQDKQDKLDMLARVRKGNVIPNQILASCFQVTIENLSNYDSDSQYVSEIMAKRVARLEILRSKIFETPLQLF